MNPGYAGRSNLPENLKKLFRSVAMARPDRELISQVMLFSQGFRTAESLASKAVPVFNLCAEQLSAQPHYDFGLRALKAVLISAGHLKRLRLQHFISDANEESSVSLSSDVTEQEIVIQSITETMTPKLVAEDVPLLNTYESQVNPIEGALADFFTSRLLKDVFPGIFYKAVDLSELERHIRDVCSEQYYQPSELWLRKTLQLYQIQSIQVRLSRRSTPRGSSLTLARLQHGVMMVGPSATGKSSSWRVLLAALQRLTKVESVHYSIDPKAISKESLYGTLDATTREWTDGLFTHILRRIVDNARGKDERRHWIVFDGDVDPEWVENLNR